MTDTAPPADPELETGRLLFAAPCRFFHAAQRLDQLPPPERPEIAFAGRSNVGKSSLINALVGQAALARASHQPGRTRQLNFFDLGGRLTLVDMPGYGYAQAAKSVKEDWQALMFAYLRGRPNLARIVLLLDARVEIKDSDRAALDLIARAAVSTIAVLTKADAVKPGRLATKQAEIMAVIGRQAMLYPELLTTSSQTGQGIPELRALLAREAHPAGRPVTGD